MKKYGILVITLLFVLTGCNTKEYSGYWCSYEESGMIIVLLNQDITEKQKNSVEDTINLYPNMSTYDFISKEDLLMNSTDENPVAYDTYFIYFSSATNIDEALVNLQKEEGVYSATKESAKSNVALYNLKKDKTFTYTDSLEEDLGTKVEGKYKIKKNEIVFTSDEEVSSLYLKDDYVCQDETCTKFFIKTDAFCEVN